MPNRTIVILDYPGASAAAVAGLVEMFDFNSRLRSQDDRSQMPVMVVSDAKFPVNARAVILPPAYGNQAYQEPNPDTVARLADLSDRTIIASACAGAFYLAAAGCLNGRRATTHWLLEDDFRKRYPDVILDIGEILIRDGRVLTAGGLLSWVDLALELVAELSGHATMRTLGRHFVVDTGRREQRFYSDFNPLTNHGDTAIAAVQKRLKADFSKPLRNRDLAHDAALSERTFLRRFRDICGLTPQTYQQRLRVQAAQHHLEDSRDNIETIAWRVGYENTNAFRKVFHKHTGLSPSQYRARNRR